MHSRNIVYLQRICLRQFIDGVSHYTFIAFHKITTQQLEHLGKVH